MLDLFSRWISRRSADRSTGDDDDTLPLPTVAENPNGKPRQLRLVKGTIVSRRIPRPLFTDDSAGDEDRSQLQYQSSTLAGSSNAAWLESGSIESGDERSAESSLSVVGPWPLPPALVRVSSRSNIHVPPTSRSPGAVSSSSDSYDDCSSSSSSPEIPPARPNSRASLRNPISSRNPLSHRPDSHPYITVSTDVYNSAYNYPLAKQLSPIQEQDYVSPESSSHSKSIKPPGGSNPSLASYASNAGSQRSEITRPSPSYSSTSHPFIARQLNRTISQTSSRTHVSSTSSFVVPPTLPSINLAPAFPGPHPSQNSGIGPQLRPRRSAVQAMPTIAGSSESAGNTLEDDDELAAYRSTDLESLHAGSFVTATEEAVEEDTDLESVESGSAVPEAMLPQTPSQVSLNLRSQELPLISQELRSAAASSRGTGDSRLPSASESFIGRRWDRDIAFGSGMVTFRVRRQWIWITFTPAFWAFWLGFLCPFLWLVGGWHFTRTGEQPPKLTWWEFYFWNGRWKEQLWRFGLCCGKRRRSHVPKLHQDVEAVAAATPTQQARLPRWVTEKQSSDDGKMRLNDPKRSLRGISFGYPFIPRQVERISSSEDEAGWCACMMRRIISTLEKPNRMLDQVYGVKLREVRGRPESGRRMIDPWVQRCRYAFCYAILLLCVALCTVSTYLIVVNTRGLH